MNTERTTNNNSKQPEQHSNKHSHNAIVEEAEVGDVLHLPAEEVLHEYEALVKALRDQDEVEALLDKNFGFGERGCTWKLRWCKLIHMVWEQRTNTDLWNVGRIDGSTLLGIADL
jgi:hypothetical protein